MLPLRMIELLVRIISATLRRNTVHTLFFYFFIDDAKDLFFSSSFFKS